MSHSVGTAPRRRVASLLTCAALAMITLAGCETKPKPTAQVAPPTVAVAPPPAPIPPAPVAPTVTPSGKPKIALLLPLTGRARELGQALQDAAELALFDGAGKDIALVPIDTGDQPDGAVAATERAIREGANLILWIAPVVVLVLGLGGVALAFRRWRAQAAGTREPDDDDRALVEAAMRAEAGEQP